MATAKEIEKIIGTPYRTIETWSRTRDDRFLLSKFLKSFSAFDIQDRIDKILIQEGLIKKSWGDFVKDLITNPKKAGVSRANKINVLESFYLSEGIDNKLDLVFTTDDKTLNILDFSSLLPSKPNVLKKIERLEKEGRNKFFSKDNNLHDIKIIIITKSRIPRFISEDPVLSNRVSILDFDEVANNLYDTNIIITGD